MNDNTNQPTLTLLALIAPQVAIAFLVFYAGGSPDNYFRATNAKYQCASETASPKIVLAGGSSVAWGSDSATFSESCGLPCVNLAINAGQGLSFRLNEAASFCNPGDVLVLSLEYTELSTKPYGQIVVKTLLYNPSSLKFMSHEELKSASDDGILELIAARTRKTLDWLLNRMEVERFYKGSNFNECGDFTGHQGQESDKTKDWVMDIFPAATELVNRLAAFDRQCQARGIEVFYRLPCIPKSTTDRNMEMLERAESQLVKIFGDRMLNRLPETLHCDDSFFDTNYHLIHSEKMRVSKILAHRLSEKICGDTVSP